MTMPSSWRTTLTLVATTAAISVLVAVATSQGWFRPLDMIALSKILDLLPARQLPASPVVLVWIEERDYQRHGHPLSDATLATALDILLDANPTVVGFDLYRDVPVEPGYAYWKSRVATSEQVVLVEKLADGNSAGVAAPDFLPAERSGFSDMPIDTDGSVRRALMMLWDNAGDVHLSFALRLALQHLSRDGITLEASRDHVNHVRLGASDIAPLEAAFGGYGDVDAGGYQVFMDNLRRYEEFDALSFSDVYSRDFDPATVRDRIVLVATASPSVKDNFIDAQGNLVYGGFIHAAITDQLWRIATGTSEPVGSLTKPFSLLWILLCCAAGGLLGHVVRRPLEMSFAALLGPVALFLLFAFVYRQGLWLLFAGPLLGYAANFSAAVILRLRRERLEKDQIMKLFGRFVSKPIVAKIWADRDQFMTGRRPVSRRAPVTILAADLSGFTRASARLKPTDVMRWIGQFMDAMARCVESHGGVINDFTGDGLMATFGAPVVRTDQQTIEQDAVNAVQCAVAMNQSLAVLNRSWQTESLPPARMRVGVCSGEVVLGAYGSDEHLKYASVGTPVNVAARLEDFDKDGFSSATGTTRILITQSTVALIGKHFETAIVGEVALRGFNEPVTIYRVELEGETFPAYSPVSAPPSQQSR